MARRVKVNWEKRRQRWKKFKADEKTGNQSSPHLGHNEANDTSKTVRENLQPKKI